MRVVCLGGEVWHGLHRLWFSGARVISSSCGPTFGLSGAPWMLSMEAEGLTTSSTRIFVTKPLLQE